MDFNIDFHLAVKQLPYECRSCHHSPDRHGRTDYVDGADHHHHHPQSIALWLLLRRLVDENSVMAVYHRWWLPSCIGKRHLNVVPDSLRSLTILGGGFFGVFSWDSSGWGKESYRLDLCGGGAGSWKMMTSSIGWQKGEMNLRFIDGGRFISSHIELILRDSLMRPEIPVRIVWQRVTSTNAMNWIISTISTKSFTQLNSGSIRTVSENPDGRIPQRCLGDSNVQISWDLFRIQWDSEGLVWDPIKILPVHTAILQSP